MVKPFFTDNTKVAVAAADGYLLHPL